MTEAAFPQPCTVDGYASNNPFGIAGGVLTKREIFAAMAMQGMLSADNTHSINVEYVSSCSVLHADSLIKAINKPSGD